MPVPVYDNKNKLLKQITDYYLESADFNGTPMDNIKSSTQNYISTITELVKEELISLNFGDRHPNPHILAFEPELVEVQLRKTKKVGLEQACLYPTKKHLIKVVDKSKYLNNPFTLMMALGEPQLSYKVFDLSVLEFYRNDPRYHYDTDDIQGSLSVKSDFFEKGKIYKRDEVFIQTFGFAYNKQLTKRAVAVYIRYLSDLSPEHQQLWYNKMLRGKYLLHPDYHRSTMGNFPEKESIFTAFVEELHQINEMSVRMGKPKLFKEDYNNKTKPRRLSFLIRPTLKEFNDFAHLLDKLLSENIDKNFFEGDIPLKFEETMPDGKIKITSKGTITLLEQWLKRVNFPDPEPKDKMLKVFRKIRKLRQPSAHDVHKDIFDQKYLKQQRELTTEAYGAIRTLRLIFANHPRAKSYDGVPDWLYKGEIWTF